MEVNISYEECIKTYDEYEQEHIKIKKKYSELKEEIESKDKQIEEINEQIKMYNYPEPSHEYSFIQKYLTKKKEYKDQIKRYKEDTADKDSLTTGLRKLQRERDSLNSEIKNIEIKLSEIELQIKTLELKIKEIEENINVLMNNLLIKEQKGVIGVVNFIEYQSGLSESEQIYAKQCIKNIIKEMYKKELEESQSKCKSEIFLPEDVTVGVEIECLAIGGISSYQIDKNGINLGNLSGVIRGLGWRVKGDESIVWYNANGERRSNDGIESVSPILTGSNKNSTEDIRGVCSFLKLYNQEINDTCGGHIHIGADYLTNAQAYINLLELWCNNEEIFYNICNKEGEVIREGAVRKEKPQAVPISKVLLQEIKQGKFKIELTDDVNSIKSKLVELQNNNPADSNKDPNNTISIRQRGINFCHLKEDSIGTIEFRLANGTIDSDVWCQNINLFGGLVVISQELSQIQMKDSQELTFEEQRKLKLYYDITENETISEEEKVQGLTELLIPQEKDREIYLKRYEVNNELLKVDSQTQQNIRKNIAEEPIRLGSIEMGKWCFVKEDRVTGEEYQEIEGMLEKANRVKEEKSGEDKQV